MVITMSTLQYTVMISPSHQRILRPYPRPNIHKFKLKGTGELSFLLGCDYFRDKDNVLCMAPKKYIEKMIGTYTRIFGVKPNRKYQSPFYRDDHPELDMSDELPIDKIKIYQSLIGQCQWIIQLGRFDIAVQR